MKTAEEIREEALKRVPVKSYVRAQVFIDGFILGAKWMQEQDNWIDFKDQQPEIYQSVNFVVDSSNERYNGKVYNGTYQGFKHGYYECSCHGIVFSATHWQPLPKQPKQNI